MPRKALENLRTQIDETDREILRLCAQRASLGVQVAHAKLEAGEAVRDRARERDVLRAAIENGAALGLDAAAVERLYQTLIELSLSGQRAELDARAIEKEGEARVAYLGGPGTYSHFAALAHFAGRHAAMAPVVRRDFASIVRAVEEGEADYAFLPIENTTTGSINEVYDLLLDTDLQIAGEHHYRVRHCVVGRGKSLGGVSTIYGHPQALAQCRRFLTGLEGVTQRFASSSARALEHAMEEGAQVAAIAGADAARLFGLNVISDRASDTEENYTRFVALAKDPTPPAPGLPSKTTIVFRTAHTPGALVNGLAAFRDERINLDRLESRPVEGSPWQEMFFLDFEANLNSPESKRALAGLEKHATSLRVLGCYGADRLAPSSVLHEDE
ncbi:prephenate dehydratase domain-containing protein [Hyphobacterium sp. HN65]|uniref:Bifunctional chorismate mutase/prephenate dehydratase n=1 Tax=Hyphobacterium lacteum TaxID=3116575 RepID=A0ABU7LLP9_9PROT|nr:prephenate dehydratase domain-containing protein [Hyphobacterium sp. HN65]MEE2524858.1 prephenate dehydratase domain-containing protein [Hyphobacterium sp. HN65]